MDRFWCAVLSLLLVAGLASAARAQERDWCQQAIMADAAGEAELAIESYTHCLDETELEADYRGMFLHQRGLAYARLGEDEAAIDDFTAAIPLVPEPDKTFSARGWSRAALGQYDKAIYDFTQAINADPDVAESWYLRGVIRDRAGDLAGALEDFDEAVALAPGEIGLLLPRAELKGRMGDRRGAIEDYGLVIEVQPRFAAAWNGRAWHRYVGGIELDKALEDVEMALTLEPDDTDIVDTKAHLKMAMGEQEEALALFVRAAELGGPDRIQWYEEELAAKGYFDGTPDGVMDDATRDAFAACIAEDCRLLADAE